ncbi:hypothetical protein [Sphingobium sp. TCM1]|uniref:hypothetical protein n=1 Tax=Sphingobium sp. TCM1 TaxID=453246 RepID=UPI0007F480EF|nr:hypothetical protein [Sphingobium sp. TCM1]OAN56927.1 hypothetical protein A7Q26_17680 [Sphingobium sp. TCM1]
MADQLSICNEALSEIAADPINSMEDDSESAFYCRQHYPKVLEELLTWTDWPFAIRRTVLASRTNDRFGEWLYRYAAPSDMAEAIRVLPSVDRQRTDIPVFGPYSFPQWDELGRLPFAIADGSIYTNVASAILEYQSNTVEPARIDALTARALALELAVRLAWPVKKSRELKGDLIRQAETARQRAVAEAENRSPRVQPDYISPVEYARMGVYPNGL